MKGPLITVVIATLAATPAGLHAPDADPPPITISGTSTVRPWECRVLAYRMSVRPDSSYAQRVMNRKDALDSLDLTIPVDSIDCGIGVMNEHLRNALRVDEHGTITFHLGSYDLGRASPGVDARADGWLTIDGTTRPIALDAHLTLAPDGKLEARGEYTVDMKDYGVKPPKLMFGMLKVGKDVKVAFDVNVDETASGVATRTDDN